MKSYTNAVKKQIMKQAWEIRKKNNVTMSVALKAAWAIAKACNRGYAIGDKSDKNYKVCVNNWEKYGKCRAYICVRVYPDKHTQNSWKQTKETKLGYVDLFTGNYIAE